MTIKAGNSANALILITDTVILNPTTGRAVVTSATLNEQTGAQETMELFISSNSTSDAAERIDKLIFSADETQAPISLGDRSVASGEFLIGKATTGSLVRIDLTFTQYTGSS